MYIHCFSGPVSQGERIEDVTDLVPDTESVCELVFATQAELEIRLEANREYEAS